MYLKILGSIFSLAPVAFLIFTMMGAGIVLAQVQDNVTVFVNVLQVSEITIFPESLNFTAAPGTFTTPQTIDIQNTGSVNVTNIYTYTDTIEDENVRPLGQTDSTFYSAGGVLLVQNETLPTFYWAGRLEWNNTEGISNMLTGGVQSPAGFGFIRNTTSEYNWLVGNGTPPTGQDTSFYCNATDSELAITNYADNGTVETRSPHTDGITNDGADDQWAYFSVSNTSLPIDDHCVAVYYNCTKIYIYAYDERAGYNTCSNSEFLQVPDLVPGATHSANLTVWMPLGIPANPGPLNTSTVTVVAT